MTDQVFVFTATEIERLHGAGPLAGFTYLHLRHWMDYDSGTVGRTRPVSLAMLAAYTETHTPRGAGTQIEQASEKAIRTALERLQRNGLLRRLAGDRLSFMLPLAVIASARPNQTRHGDGTEHTPEPGTAEPTQDAGLKDEPGTVLAGHHPPNPAHIMNHVNLSSSTCDVIDCLKHQDIRTAGKESMIAGWVGKGVTLEHVKAAIIAARATREAENSTQPLNVGLLNAVLRNGVNPRRKPASLSEDELVRLGNTHGLPPRAGESWADYRRRLQAQIA